MRNEKGFILPVTLFISILFFLAFTYQINMYISDQLFNKETEELFILENLMQLGVVDVLTEINENSIPAVQTQLNYPIGTVTYTVQELSSTTATIFITCKTNDNRVYSSKFTYDLLKEEIITWSELR